MAESKTVGTAAGGSWDACHVRPRDIADRLEEWPAVAKGADAFSSTHVYNLMKEGAAEIRKLRESLMDAIQAVDDLRMERLIESEYNDGDN